MKIIYDAETQKQLDDIDAELWEIQLEYEQMINATTATLICHQNTELDFNKDCRVIALLKLKEEILHLKLVG